MNIDIFTLAERVIREAKDKGLTIATAESCTGGGIGQALTAVSGSSSVFMGGAITYSNTAKENVLGVPQDMLIKHGAVSEPVAKCMAESAAKLLKADLAVSATGIAGPSGGTDAKPVGLVYVGLARKGEETQVTRLELGDIGRDAVRQDTIRTALGMLGVSGS